MVPEPSSIRRLYGHRHLIPLIIGGTIEDEPSFPGI
jgi:hypothetical protein